MSSCHFVPVVADGSGFVEGDGVFPRDCVVQVNRDYAILAW